MKNKDEEIAALKKIRRNLTFSDIKGDGVFIGDQWLSFSPRMILEKMELYLPESLIKMPEEMAVMKYPSVHRPKEILTSLDGTVNFGFNLFYMEWEQEGQIAVLAEEMKELLRKSNPSYLFGKSQKGTLPNGVSIYRFDYRSCGVDEKLYNMVCFAPVKSGVFHGVFNCLEREADQWKSAAWQAFQTVKDTDS